MMNQVIVVGRLVATHEVRETENGKKVTNVTLAVPRSYKNMDGNYDTDFIECTLFNAIATNTSEYCKKGDVVGVKGRIQIDNYEKDGVKKKVTQIIADKVTFLSSAKEHQKDDELEV